LAIATILGRRLVASCWNSSVVMDRSLVRNDSIPKCLFSIIQRH
jgi:hypothetical protein